MEVAVVGTGAMGSSLAQAHAQNGIPVALVGRTQESLDRALSAIERELRDAVEKRIFTQSRAEEIQTVILTTTDPGDICPGKSLNLVIESVTEDLAVKRSLFQRLDELCPPAVVLATNTSSLDAEIIAAATSRPERVVWMHYFYPPHKNRAAEYAGTARASADSVDIAERYLRATRREAVRLRKYRKGGAANIVLVASLLEAVCLLDDGIDVPSIEEAGKQAFGCPVGFLGLLGALGMPLALSCVKSFSDSSNPDDPLYRVYDNFFSLPPGFRRKMMEAQSHRGESVLGRLPAAELGKPAEDQMLVDVLKRRFQAVAFMTAAEVVDAGVIAVPDLEKLCRTAFIWQEGPFALMNRMGVREALRLVTERMEVSHKLEVNFPVPQLLIDQAQRGEPWTLQVS